MDDITPNFRAVSEAVAIAIAEMGEPPALYPNWQQEMTAYAILVDCLAPDRPDAADVYMAASVVIGLTRTASDRESLDLLRGFLSGRWRGRSTAQMTAAAIAWSRRANDNRRKSLERIAACAVDLQQDVTGHGYTDEADVLAELEELWAELRDLYRERMQPYLSAFAWLEQTRAVKALARAVKSFRRQYVFRVDPLDTLAKVDAARAGIARGLK